MVDKTMKTIKLGDIIKEKEAESLANFVNIMCGTRVPRPVHKAVLEWLDKNQQVLERFKENQILREYGAYMLEYYLKL